MLGEGPEKSIVVPPLIFPFPVPAKEREFRFASAGASSVEVQLALLPNASEAVPLTKSGRPPLQFAPLLHAPEVAVQVFTCPKARPCVKTTAVVANNISISERREWFFFIAF